MADILHRHHEVFFVNKSALKDGSGHRGRRGLKV